MMSEFGRQIRLAAWYQGWLVVVVAGEAGTDHELQCPPLRRT